MSLLANSSLSLRKTPSISDSEFEDLRKFIYDSMGIDIPLRRKYLLENRLGKRLQELNLTSFADYYKYLRFAPGKAKEMDVLCEKITTNETSFWRDIKQLEAFRDHALADVMDMQQKAGDKSLNIWSAGCSSGEEPYTLAMMLHELLRMTIIGWNIRITANDLSPAMVAKARRATYNEHALRTTPKEIVQRYFTQETIGYKVHPKVTKLVSLGLINLNDSLAVKRVPRSHIIFCRNVIIYFDDAMKKKVIGAFYDNLLPGGYLVLGHSESIHKISRAFKPVIKPGGIMYRKEP